MTRIFINKNPKMRKCISYVMTFMLLLCSVLVFGQGRTVTGIVNDDLGPIVGANVVVKGTTNGDITNVDGRFSISNVQPNAILQVRFIGYAMQEITVGNQTSFEIMLLEDIAALEEVIVIGYGTVAKKDVTTAVANVSTKDIAERPITDAVQAIQGRAAGVFVITPSGAPGADMVIRVRGNTSYTGSNDPLYVVDGTPVSNISHLSPNDIASMQILKDASSAAIYGSRAANGVVLITTTQGGNEARISANIRYGFTQVGNRIEPLNAAQYKDLVDELYPGRDIIPATDTVDKTDWHDLVFHTATNSSYNVQISDGTRNLRYLVSAGYQKDEGVVESTFMERYTFRMNVDNQVRQWLKIGANVSYTDRIQNGITTGYGSNRNGIILAVINLPTALVPRTDEGWTRSFYGVNTVNPLETITDGKNDKNRTNTMLFSGSATITPLTGLDFVSRISYQRVNGYNTSFTEPKHWSYLDSYGSASESRRLQNTLTFTNTLNYKKTIGNHNLEVMLGTEWMDYFTTTLGLSGSVFRDLRDADGNYVGLKSIVGANNYGLSAISNQTGASAVGLLSYFGRIAYNYESKYLLTLNARRDGSSRLHPNHRWGTFPSASVAWRISAEDFMKNFEWLSDMKLRLSWGKTGNQTGINYYAYLQRYNITRQPWYSTGLEYATVILSPSNLRNSDLTWETTTQTNIGLDASLFNSRLNLALDWYYKYTTDMLMNVQLPEGAAVVNTLVRNEGEMSNRGWEVTVNSVNLTGALRWTTEFVISGNKNRLEKLALQQIYMDVRTTDAFREADVVRNEPGGPLGRFWGYISDGVDPQTGDIIYRDINGDGRISATDKTFMGDPNPDFTYGLTNTFTYKGISLTLFIQGSQGNDIFNAGTGDIMGMYDMKNQSARVVDRWRKPGDITDIPKVNFNMQPSTYFVEDGSYLRVKDITLSYNFSRTVLRKMGVSRLQPFFTASNLLTFTKYKGMDPEVSEMGGTLTSRAQGVDWGTYPHSKRFVFGLNFEF